MGETTYEEEIERRLDELRQKASEYADAAALRFNLEHARKSILAMEKKSAAFNGIKTAAGQETHAYASEAYQNWLSGATEAVRNHERLRMEFDVIRIKQETWRTIQANNRFEKRNY